MGIMYFIGAAEMLPIKIGISSTTQTTSGASYRCKEMQTACPYRLITLGAIVASENWLEVMAVERATHERYKAHRLMGEWFQPTRRLLREIIAVRYMEARPADEPRRRFLDRLAGAAAMPTADLNDLRIILFGMQPDAGVWADDAAAVADRIGGAW